MIDLVLYSFLLMDSKKKAPNDREMAVETDTVEDKV